ncbi:hypothetical protein M9H77_24748 [Catharanthus roseus]|uniref:Uncharacterized protein n=1 Tax=Catharanthus roseus TaxID=4058 RepID=A0ACC0A6S5_CATRO|nr:hypothetical protein M9H77_24748 [Catharanthus roseus]
MSRCFPFPPPGYTSRRASNEALIESIKLQKEKDKAKEERKKEKRREKDEKKKLKKEKPKLNTSVHDACGAKSWEGSKCGYLQNGKKHETEQLERSSITEEHGLPQNPSYSSDSTENSNKRKRHAPAPNGTRVQGNILRIRLPSQKITDDKKQLCSTSTSGRRETSDSISIRAEQDRTCSTSLANASIAPSLPKSHDNELRRPSSHQTLVTSQENIHSSEHVSKRFKKMQKVAQKYTDLAVNWIPPSTHFEASDADDQEWLFGTKQEHQLVQRHTDEKNDKVLSQISCSSSASLWPAAQYLPGADIYSLPYTIPF